MKLVLFIVLTLCLTVTPALPFPDNGVISNFTGADGTTPIDANWTNCVIFGASSVNLKILSNGGTTVTSANEADHCSVTTYNAAQEVYIDIKDVSAANDFWTVCIRLVQVGASATDGYCAYADDGNGHVHLIDVVDGVQSGADLLDVVQAIGNADGLGLKGSGDTISVWYRVGAGSWTELGNVSNSAHQAGGKIGFTLLGDSTVSMADNAGGGNLTSTRKPVPLIFFQ